MTDSTPSIFVSIASYRDRLCPTTLRHLFEKAHSPQRIHVGLCQQNNTKQDVECLDAFPFPYYRSNIRVHRLDYKQAKGPTYARYLCASLYENEDFFMQIDSHMLFVQDWDQKAIHMIREIEKKTGSAKTILSHYPPEYKDYQENPTPNDLVTHIVDYHVNPQGILSFAGAVFKQGKPFPTRNLMIAAGFFFTQGTFIHDVPFDPHLPFLFAGEELLLSVRAFTHGYDVYTPNQNLVYHMYTRPTDPKFWEDHTYSTNDVHKKVKILSGLVQQDLKTIQNRQIRQSLQTYGLGNERTLDEFYHLLGFDPIRQSKQKPLLEFFVPSNLSNVTMTIRWFAIVVSLLFLFLVIILNFQK